MVAANPRNGKNLVGAAITEARPSGGQACRTYASDDGGSSWNASEFREQIEFGGGDPQVAITPAGTALFTALAFVKDDKGQDRAGLYVYRSEDGGRSWKPPADLGYSYDHEQIAVDRTFGKYAGRVYIGVLHDYPVYRVGVFRSGCTCANADGRTPLRPMPYHMRVATFWHARLAPHRRQAGPSSTSAWRQSGHSKMRSSKLV